MLVFPGRCLLRGTMCANGYYYDNFKVGLDREMLVLNKKTIAHNAHTTCQQEKNNGTNDFLMSFTHCQRQFAAQCAQFFILTHDLKSDWII